MNSVKSIAQNSHYTIYPLASKVRDIGFSRRQFFRPARKTWAGNSLHDALQFDVHDVGIDPMLERFRMNIGPIAQDHISDQKVFVPGIFEGRLDWVRFTKRSMHFIDFKWMIDGLPKQPRDVDVRQVALYAYALHSAFPSKWVYSELAYFFGGNRSNPAGIRIFSFRYERELIGIANGILQRN